MSLALGYFRVEPHNMDKFDGACFTVAQPPILGINYAQFS